jgi:hypothetical protein
LLILALLRSPYVAQSSAAPVCVLRSVVTKPVVYHQIIIVAMVKSSFVFLPLYLYPYNTSSWSAIEASVVANPNLDFEIVVAPNLANVYPDEHYATALESLNNFTNVRTLGYVPTSYAGRDITAVKSQIDCYAAWGTNGTNPLVVVQGIFFDEVPSAYTNDTFNYMSDASNYAKSALGVGRRYITFNPGVPIDSSFYNLADNVIIFENTWSEFNLTRMLQVPWNIMAKSTYLIHSFTAGDIIQAEVINNLTDSNVQGLYVTTTDGYDQVSALWPQLCEELADKIDGGDYLNGDVRCADCEAHQQATVTIVQTSYIYYTQTVTMGIADATAIQVTGI